MVFPTAEDAYLSHEITIATLRREYCASPFGFRTRSLVAFRCEYLPIQGIDSLQTQHHLKILPKGSTFPTMGS